MKNNTNHNSKDSHLFKNRKDPNIIFIFKEIFRLLSPRYKGYFFLLFVAMIIMTGIEALTLGAIAFFVSAVSDPDAALQSTVVAKLNSISILNPNLNSNESLIIFVCVSVVGLVALKNLTNGFVNYFSVKYSLNVKKYLGERIFTGFLYTPYEWHVSRNSSDLVLGVMWRHFFGNFLDGALLILKDSLIVLVMFISLIIIEPVVTTIIVLTVGGGGFLIFTIIKRKLDQIASLAKEYRQTINRDVATGIHGIKDIKAFGIETGFINRFRVLTSGEVKWDVLHQIFLQLPRWLLEVLGFLMLASAIYYLYFYVEASSTKITGTMALLAVTAWRVLPAISSILSLLAHVRTAIPYVQTNLDYLSDMDKYRASTFLTKPQNKNEKQFKKSIILENVSFQYREAPRITLENISLTIEKGETLGIVGVSGAGKSTFVDLLLGLLIPTEGKISIDDHVQDASGNNGWTRLFGYVPQSPFLCDGTIAENIAFGLEGDKINRDRVLLCCQMAAIDSFLNELPVGIDTRIGERGVKLSGGQKQRVAIARALYHDPDILIFDEATSSLDSKSERAIQNTIYSFKGKQTLIIIAHRLSTVEDCDRLIWLDKGKIAKAGSTGEILPAYRKIMKR